ncbi:MAG TPA: LLM class F420-dependent oxidoreductase [Acidimicrobiales bacterium]|nr:LLM class F420-dependent oxidoreductase [Acidimicrobiales bacterium]
MDLGPVGVWWSATWRRADDGSTTVAPELEALGYRALWSSGGFGPGLTERFERLLAATTQLTVASGVVSIWAASHDEIARAVADLDARHPRRFVLGLGVSHAAIARSYALPYTHMVRYLDMLDEAGPAVAKDRRVLAALGPRMLALARDRAAGAHPYFVPVEHTARARSILGEAPLLAPEVTVVLERDPTTARGLARTFTAQYLTLPNYADNLRSLGFGDDDLAGGGSDRLVDAVVAWGDVEAVAARIEEHHAAGADHVCVQVLSALDSFPLTAYRELAPALIKARSAPVRSPDDP